MVDLLGPLVVVLVIGRTVGDVMCVPILINLHNMHPQRGIQLVLSVLLCTTCVMIHEVGRPAHNHPTDGRTLGTTSSGPGDLGPMGHTSCVM